MSKRNKCQNLYTTVIYGYRYFISLFIFYRGSSLQLKGIRQIWGQDGLIEPLPPPPKQPVLHESNLVGAVGHQARSVKC